MIEMKIERFLQLALFASQHRPLQIQLRQQAPGGDIVLMTWAISEDLSVYDENKLTEWSHEISDLAQDNANGFASPTSYYLQPFYTDQQAGAKMGAWRMRSTEPFSGVEGNELAAYEPGHGSIGAMPMGPSDLHGGKDSITAQLASQMMRHNEVLTRTMTQTMLGMLSSQQAVIERQSSHIERMEKTHYDAVIALEQTYSEQHERKLQTEQFTAAERRKAEMFKKIMPLVPLIVAKFDPTGAAKKLLPAGTGHDAVEDAALVESITEAFSGLEPAQINKIAEALGPAAIPLFDVYEKFMKAKDRRKSEDEKTAGTPTPPNGGN